jgi:purine-binding chemotaxis protein CheW
MIMNRRGTDRQDMNDYKADISQPDSIQFISFSLGDQEYGLDIMFVREIKAWTETTRLPNSPEYMRGVINLRGAIVPVIDLGARFGTGITVSKPSSVIVIVAIAGTLTGLLVDAVSDIITVDRNEVALIPEIDGEQRNPYFSGLVTVHDKLIAIVILENLLGREANSKAETIVPSMAVNLSAEPEIFALRA